MERVGRGLIKELCRTWEGELVCLLEMSATLNLKRGIKISQMPCKGPHPIGVTWSDSAWWVSSAGQGHGRQGGTGEAASGDRGELMVGVRCHLVGDLI